MSPNPGCVSINFIKFYEYNYGIIVGGERRCFVIFNLCMRIWQDELLSSSRLCNAIIALLTGELKSEDNTESLTNRVIKTFVQGVKLPETIPQFFHNLFTDRPRTPKDIHKVYYNTINYEKPAKDYILAVLQQLQNNAVTDYIKAVEQRKSDNPNKEQGPFHGTLDEVMTPGLLESCDVVLTNSYQFRSLLDNLLKNNHTQALNTVCSVFGNIKGVNAVLAKYWKKLNN